MAQSLFMDRNNFRVLLFQIILCVSVMFFSCKSNSKFNSYSLTNTKWMVIGVSLDSNNTYDTDSRLAVKEFNSSQGLYSDYQGSILINYLNNSIDTTPYRQKGDLIFYNDNKNEKLATRILKHTKDSLLILTPDGAYIKMVRVDTIPK